MTKLIVVDKSATFLPVIFTLYRTVQHDRKVGVNEDGTPKILKKGSPDFSTMMDVTLMRRVKVGPNGEKIETVLDTINRLRNEVLSHSPNVRYKLKSAAESDEELAKRKSDPNLVWEDGTKAAPIIPPKPVSDEEVGVVVDNGKHKSVKKVPKAKMAKAA
ncbi:MAG: hypothetical protein EKK63_10145 [Acinetobacter sp.]|uniref:hypothetical protein n=1 Tax=Acinetobacter sp. TaxID=472 RepID=UPI000FA9F823|nr:hypothetical protein [Acinetobacter sp.]RUP39350.1 MAG: hypothetical protein EKK63_10145 [Acinetobacter sp.]